MKNIILTLSKISVCAICICLLGIVSAEASTNKLGDVNTDNLVNASDSLLVLCESAGLEDLDDYQKSVADVNEDEAINAIDALQILKVAADIDVFTINVDLTVGEEYVIDGIYGGCMYAWKYKVEPENGINIEHTVNVPENSNPGDPEEQIYTITAQEPGIYELHLEYTKPWDETAEPEEERVYIINVKEEIKPAPEIVKVRVTGADDVISYPMAKMISTYDDYVSYATDLKDCILYYYDIDKVDVYGEEFFETNNLLVVSLEETSGTHHIQYKEIKKDENGKCVVCIDRFYLEVVTDDMAYWKMLIPLEGKDWADEEFEISITEHYLNDIVEE